MKAKKIMGIGCLGILIILIGVVGFVYYNLTQNAKHYESAVVDIQLTDKNGATVTTYYEEVDIVYADNTYVVNLNYNGKVYPFVIDTGALFVISDDFVKEANLGRPSSQIKLTNALGKTSTANQYEINKIGLGTLVFNNLKATVGWTPDAKASVSSYGSIGYQLLRGSHFVQLNAARDKLILSSNKEKLTGFNTKNKLDFTYQQGKVFDVPGIGKELKNKVIALSPTIKGIEINGEKNPNSITEFDSGNTTHYVTLTSDLFKKYKNPEKLHTIKILIYGNGQKAVNEYQASEAKSIKLGEIEFKNVPILEVNSLGVVDVGAYVMRHLNTTFDWGQKHQQEGVYLAPIGRSNTIDLSPESSFGIGLRYENNKVIVGKIVVNGVVEKAGIHFGDQIIKWGQTDVSNITAKQFKDYFYYPNTAIKPLSDAILGITKRQDSLHISVVNKKGDTISRTIQRHYPFSKK
ncbi:aspartyl protease family protein [Tenacibaculum amylolyticum]|uniref:aspartyl protease family protein n=1 Tax=Tenacibaculum amylolyticum TaxID=104269 RepID=UPI003892E234